MTRPTERPETAQKTLGAGSRRYDRGKEKTAPYRSQQPQKHGRHMCRPYERQQKQQTATTYRDNVRPRQAGCRLSMKVHGRNSGREQVNRRAGEQWKQKPPAPRDTRFPWALFVGSARPQAHPAVIRLGTHLVTADHGLLSLPEIDFRSLRQSRGRLRTATQSLGRPLRRDGKSVTPRAWCVQARTLHPRRPACGAGMAPSVGERFRGFPGLTLRTLYDSFG